MYPDIDYINKIYFYVRELSYHIRKRKTLNEDLVNEMISLTIDLLNILHQFLDDKYYYKSTKKQKIFLLLLRWQISQ